MAIIIPANKREEYQNGGFHIYSVNPGIENNESDNGLGALGSFDHATLSSNVIVPMHEHSNDEIFSYIYSGEIYHEDTLGARFPLTPNHMAVMNSGSGLSHEESTSATDGGVEMLQIFVRPREVDSKPIFQDHKFPTAISEDQWRALAGPDNEQGFPFFLRNDVRIYDADLKNKIKIPTTEGWYSYLYIFKGEAQFENKGLIEGDSILITDSGEYSISSENARVVMFSIKKDAVFTRAGTISG